MSPELEQALSRLLSALDGLDAGVARHFDVDARRSDLETELQIMQDDRARLATDLESAAAQLARTNGTVDHVSLRLTSAIRTIQTVLRGASQDADETRT